MTHAVATTQARRRGSLEGKTILFAALGIALAAVGAAQGGYFPVSWGWGALALLWGAGLALVLTDRLVLARAEIAFLVLLAGLTGWIALSLLWSGNGPQTIDELERILVYLAGTTAFLLAVRTETTDVVLAATLVALSGICAYALATRLFPRALSADVFGGYRLSTPVGYWNGLGLIAAIGALLALGFVVNGRTASSRAGAAAAVPVLVCTLYFTYSRGAWLALAAGVVFAIAASPLRLRITTMVLALGLVTALALWLASGSHALSHTGATLSDSAHQGHRLAAWLVGVVMLAAAAVLGVDLLGRRVRFSTRARRIYAATLAGAAAIGIIVGLIAGGGPVHLAKRGWNGFTGNPVSSSNLNKRLFNLSSNGRTELWHVARNEFSAHPVLGGGAGSFEAYWNQHRPSDQTVRDAHNLYLETLAELGFPGFLLLAGALAIPFTALRARDRPLVAIALGAYTALLVHAFFDWDWELPGVFLPGLLCGLAALITARDETQTVVVGRRGRIALLGATGVCAAFSFVSLIGNIALSRAQSAIDTGHYAKAASNARRAADWAPWSGRPWLELGTAQARLGLNAQAVNSLRTAVRNDPANYKYWLALAAVATGRERVTALERVSRLNPRYHP